MNTDALKDFVNSKWDEEIIPELEEYIKIPAKSPHFDADWEKHGYIDEAIAQAEAWCKKQPVDGMHVEVVKLKGRTPLLYVEVEGQKDDTVVLYGHLDKQPEFTGWEPDLGPWKPVIRDGKLYGRGGADDGYAVFGSLTAIAALQKQGIPHARCVLLIETCEESGSYDLPPYIDHLAERIGTPDLVVCLDAECGNYEQLWTTTSLRGNLVGTLRVDVLEEGVHSGSASGIVPSSFRILREVMERIEDPATGQIHIDEMNVAMPEERLEQARKAADALGDTIAKKYPFAAEGMRPVADDSYELLLNNSWRPTLSVTGVDGIPPFSDAGNVLRPYTAIKVSFRLPPTCDAHAAGEAVKQKVESDPPYGAKVSFSIDSPQGGWNAPAIDPWLDEAMQQASRNHFGRDAMYMGMGGSIPFMGLLAEKFPKSQFLVTGVLGPKSNAHGPNEFLHIDTGKKLTACVAEVLAAHAKQ
ncbi:acetylornithine deacetylase/succinyl-diaminopimelate desuccinylase-like protein [Natronospira proteinivora]|uniref:Acetylornithine deacetylase/succinyl-diaminopimelate desuccinylase-like protein n=1 Tax=Natronospira proteinivora TaxID=1807133 RepID=A0ABT1G8W0_9GAMM|nr:M20 family metallopeptidase [Natronospira proteinivora]MCP1726768.1 acetylornithine deacetylase/succinyl-diaminopimelate desuccinylase-like protein [Natronospira proteinivora]